jgi:hypothetical protein
MTHPRHDRWRMGFRVYAQCDLDGDGEIAMHRARYSGDGHNLGYGEDNPDRNGRSISSVASRWPRPP